MSETRSMGFPTLFGGDVTSFVHDEGSRMSESLFRLREDPPHTETFAIASDELNELRQLAERYGIRVEEFTELCTYASSRALKDPEGELFIDTEVGQETYFGGPPTVVFGEGQGADAMAYITSKLVSVS